MELEFPCLMFLVLILIELVKVADFEAGGIGYSVEVDLLQAI